MRTHLVTLTAFLVFLSVANVSFGLTMKITDIEGEQMTISYRATFDNPEDMAVVENWRASSTRGLRIKVGAAAVMVPWTQLDSVKIERDSSEFVVELVYKDGKTESRALYGPSLNDVLVGNCALGLYEISLQNIREIDVIHEKDDDDSAATSQTRAILAPAPASRVNVERERR